MFLQKMVITQTQLVLLRKYWAEYDLYEPELYLEIPTKTEYSDWQQQPPY